MRATISSFLSRIAVLYHPRQLKPHDLPGQVVIPFIETVPDNELRRLNRLLPWRSYVLDSKGRPFGYAPPGKKRSKPQAIPDRRIELLDARLGLSDKSVLEVGCFEGNHTVALAQKSERVIAVDSRIENVVKTMVRCAFFGVHATVARWNVEEALPTGLEPSYDILHHVGVLYHLHDPVRHLRAVLPRVRVGVMLDTHVAAEDRPLDQYYSDNCQFSCFTYRERGRSDPFSGMARTSRWLLLRDLLNILKECGFADVEVIEKRVERNGPRILILARRAAEEIAPSTRVL